MPAAAGTSLRARSPLRPEASAWLLAIAGLLAMYVPTFVELSRTVWATDAQGHGPIILGVVVWLTWQRRGACAALSSRPAHVAGGLVFGLGLLAFVLGRSQGINTIELGSLIPVAIGVLLLLKGWPAVRVMLFPLFFVLFMVPLPGVFVQAVTTPLKATVSYVAAGLLGLFEYPVARSGVILYVGPYQLLVADACAGLNSMFTLEALSLLYLNIMRYSSRWRNVFIAMMAIPVAFCANVIRVIILILVTYHLGNDAGQGFLHGLAGLVLFAVAFVLLLAVDSLYGAVARLRNRDKGALR